MPDKEINPYNEIIQILRSTEEYDWVCCDCRDNILLYSNISGRTNYSDIEVECKTLNRIISKSARKDERIRELEEVEKLALHNIDVDTAVINALTEFDDYEYEDVFDLINQYKSGMEEVCDDFNNENIQLKQKLSQIAEFAGSSGNKNPIENCWTLLNRCDNCNEKLECGLQNPFYRLQQIKQIAEGE